MPEQSSLFNPAFQTSSTESKIIVALERIAESFRVLLWKAAKTHQLSPLQIQILVFIYYHEASWCKVTFLAQEFNMTKATISDAVKSLFQKGLIEKVVQTGDTRSYAISISEKGQVIMPDILHFARELVIPLNAFSETQKNALFALLLQFIHKLSPLEIIAPQRMCFSCFHFRQEGGAFYCDHFKTPLITAELRIDCARFEQASFT